MRQELPDQPHKGTPRRTAGIIAPATDRRGPLERMAAEAPDVDRVRPDTARHQGEADRREHSLASAPLRLPPDDPRQRRQHEDPVQTSGGCEGAEQTARDPMPPAKTV